MCILPSRAESRHEEILGSYFSKKKYIPEALPTFEATRASLPQPIDDAHPEWLKVYWAAWRIDFATSTIQHPEAGSFPPLLDPGFNENTFLWDTCFMTRFCNYAHPLVPGISSLDNFYAHQHKDGGICREISRATGADYAPWVNRKRKSLFSRWGWPASVTSGTPKQMMPVTYVDRNVPKDNPDLTLDALDHPVVSWAELSSFDITGNGSKRDCFQSYWGVSLDESRRKLLDRRYGPYKAFTWNAKDTWTAPKVPELGEIISPALAAEAPDPPFTRVLISELTFSNVEV